MAHRRHEENALRTQESKEGNPLLEGGQVIAKTLRQMTKIV